MPFPTIVDGSVFAGHAGADTTTFIISVPNHDPGDVLYVAFVQDGGPATITFTGWTSLGNVNINGGDATFELFKKTASGAEPASYTLTTTVSERAAWAAWAVRNDGGVHGTPLLDSPGAGTTVTWGNYVLNTPGCLLFHGVATADVTTPMTGPSARQLGEFSTASGGSIGIWYEFYPFAITTTFTSVTLSSSRGFARIVLAIAPANANPTPLPAPQASSTQRIRTYLP